MKPKQNCTCTHTQHKRSNAAASEYNQSDSEVEVLTYGYEANELAVECRRSCDMFLRPLTYDMDPNPKQDRHPRELGGSKLKSMCGEHLE